MQEHLDENKIPTTQYAKVISLQDLEKDLDKHTPVMKQYIQLRNKYPEHLLLYRMGDFYEFFYDDAYTAAKVLDIQLTKRGKSGGEEIPMSGIPAHALDSYLPKLIKNGFTVAMCEQKNDEDNPKLMKREVVRIITAGTVTDEGLTNDTSLQYLTVVAYDNSKHNDKNYGIVHFLSTNGSVQFLPNLSENELVNELDKLKPVELLLEDNSLISGQIQALKLPIYYKPKWLFDKTRAKKIIKEHAPYINQEFLDRKELSSYALAALINHLENTQINISLPITKIEHIDQKKYLYVDKTTRRNLELDKNLRGGEENSLFSILKQTKTNMGTRALIKKMHSISTDIEQIKNSHALTEEIVKNTEIIGYIRKQLSSIGDGERLLSRLRCQTARPKELVRLSISLSVIPCLSETISLLKSSLGLEYHSTMVSNEKLLSNLSAFLNKAIVDSPPNSIRDGGVIARGFDDELDTLRDNYSLADEKVVNFEHEERQKVQIPIKVAYQSAQGFFIEISRSVLDKSPELPDDYRRVQSLKNTERFTCEKLKELEGQILGAKSRSISREKIIYQQALEHVQQHFDVLQIVFDVISQIDVHCAFAFLATKHQWIKPNFVSTSKVDNSLLIEKGRHPIVEIHQEEPFSPNDLHLGHECDMHVITGPNMGGKSTFMRQCALIVIMAYMGSFVPANAAKIGNINSIFTRIGASDDLASGQSTFMVEMVEAASILHQASQNSLVLMDEIGRGTNSIEGLALALAIAEHLAKIQCKTLFATHYFEVSELAEKFTNIKNIHVQAKLHQEKLYFDHKIHPGSSEHSYGIAVAKLAGMPQSVINIAEKWLKNISINTNDSSQYNLFKSIDINDKDKKNTHYDNLNLELINQLNSIEPNNLTPLEALEKLYLIKNIAKNT